MIIKKLIKRLLIVISALILLFGFFIYSSFRKFSNQIQNISINEIQLSSIEDGIYIGQYEIGELLGAVVEVTIRNHEIVKIDLIEHKNGKGQKAESIIDDVIHNQSLQVDAITGATGSSKILLKAIENALNSHIK